MRGKPLAKNTRLILHFAENKRPTRETIAPHPPSPSPHEFGLRLIKFQVNSSEFTRRGGAIFHNQKPELSTISSQPSRIAPREGCQPSQHPSSFILHPPSYERALSAPIQQSMATTKPPRIKHKPTTRVTVLLLRPPLISTLVAGLSGS